MKKPHFWKLGSCWFCGTARTHGDWGLGFTPREAWEQYHKGGWFNVDTHLSKGTA